MPDSIGDNERKENGIQCRANGQRTPDDIRDNGRRDPIGNRGNGKKKKDGLTEMDTLDFALAIEDVGSA